MDRSKWEYKKWADVLNIINGRDYKEVVAVDGAYPICGSGGEIGRANDFLCPANTVIIGRKGNINKPIFIEEKFWNIDTAFGLVAKESYLLPRFLFYFCLHYDFERHNKAVTIPSLTKGDLLKINMLVPLVEDQQRIVAELDCLNKMIAVKQEQLKEFDKLAQSIFYDMFGDPINNEKQFPKLTIDDVIKFEGGSQPARSYFEYEPTPDNIRLIQIRDYKTDAYITYIPKKMARRFCEEDDIMIGRYGPPIFQILRGLKGAYNVALMKAVPKKGNKEFIRAFLKQECLLHYLENFSRRVAGQDGIQMDELKAYPFPYPPLSLQQQFADKISAIETQKELVKQSIAETQVLLDYTMDYYFNE